MLPSECPHVGRDLAITLTTPYGYRHGEQRDVRSGFRDFQPSVQWALLLLLSKVS
ncbi:MAG: hypothetical protein LBJ43_01505 [Propionibacteriaceae bacterium]|jgi:hypothetical protein|nr:hypothetical protein [Propionibacteriaceae bacterium]